jgi:C-terminal processing protease CtpA/Prc
VANNVRPDFPADKAGLRDGDYILEVNGESIDNTEHDSVVNKISAQPTQVDLLVVADLNSYLANRQQLQQTAKPVVAPTSPASKVDVEIKPIQPIQEFVKKDEISRHDLKLIPEFNGLGISLAANGVISAVEPNSPADRAGLKKDNKIVEVNGVDVKNKSNKEIAKVIKENEKNLQVGVVKMAPKIEQPTTSTAADELKASRTDLSSASSHKISGLYFIIIYVVIYKAKTFMRKIYPKMQDLSDLNF